MNLKTASPYMPYIIRTVFCTCLIWLPLPLLVWIWVRGLLGMAGHYRLLTVFLLVIAFALYTLQMSVFVGTGLLAILDLMLKRTAKIHAKYITAFEEERYTTERNRGRKRPDDILILDSFKHYLFKMEDYYIHTKSLYEIELLEDVNYVVEFGHFSRVIVSIERE